MDLILDPYRIYHRFAASEVSGNIHVALGKSVQRDGKLVHEFNIEDIGSLDKYNPALNQADRSNTLDIHSRICRAYWCMH